MKLYRPNVRIQADVFCQALAQCQLLQLSNIVCVFHVVQASPACPKNDSDAGVQAQFKLLRCWWLDS